MQHMHWKKNVTIKDKLRLQSWRHKMQFSIRSCYQWIKTPQYSPFRGLFSTNLNHLDATRCVSDALVLIRDHWRLVWRRPSADLSEAINRIDDELNRLQFQPAAQHQWLPLTAEQLATRAACLKGKAGGPDNWSGDEIASIPADHMQLFADFCALCETVGMLPSKWTYAAQCHLPKSSERGSPQ